MHTHCVISHPLPSICEECDVYLKCRQTQSHSTNTVNDGDWRNKMGLHPSQLAYLHICLSEKQHHSDI